MSTTAKSLMEFVTGTVFLSQMHMGEFGIPIVASHLGGVLGGALYIILQPCPCPAGSSTGSSSSSMKKPYNTSTA